MRVFILLLLLPNICLSQSEVDAEQFFNRGLSIFSSIEKVDGDQVKFPWIDKYEFRSETRDFDVDEQEYSIRLSPSTSKIRKAQKALYEQIRTAPDFEGQEQFCDYILSLQIDWLNLFIIHEHERLLGELEAVINDKTVIYERMAGSYEIEARELVKLQIDKSEIEVDVNRLQLEQEYIRSKYDLHDESLDFDQFITIATISDLLKTRSPRDSVLIDFESEYEKGLLVKEMELESAERKRVVEFVQLKYNGPHADPFRERVSIGVGFQLNNSGSDRLKMQELKIERDELELESRRDRLEQEEELVDLKRKLHSDIQSFLQFQETMERERKELEDIGKGVFLKEGSSPLLLLEIESRRIGTEMKAIGKKEKLLEDFLKYLHERGEMCGDTFINHLTM